MKKILTVLLSFLMVATLGIVNVSADTSDDYENLNYDGIRIQVTGKKSTTFTYNGSEQTLYTLTCTGGQRKQYGECTYKYAISTSSSIDDGSIAWEQSTSSNKNQTLELKAIDAGTYYLHLKKPGDDGSHNIWGYGDGSQAISHSVTIERKDTTVTINTPKASGTTEGVPYYIVSKSSGNVTLPFTKSTEVDDVATKWETATITGPNSSIYSGSDITFSTEDGKLTIKAGNLATGTYKVVLKASVDESITTTPTKNYKGSATKTIYIYKVDDQTDFTVGFDESIPQREGNIIYGKTAQDIINAVSSVVAGSDTIYGAEGNPTEVVTADTYIEKKTSSGGNSYTRITDNSETLSVVDNDSYYRITVRLKHKYGTGDSDVYCYNVRDTFKIVRKDASATVTATKKDDGSSLVYNGEDQVLATAIDINPDSDSSTTAASIKYKVVPGAKREIATQQPITAEDYNRVSGDEVESPTAKDAGRYSIYFHVQHGSSGNYQDSYGVITNKIERATLTVTGLENSTITYDGKEHEPNINISGFVDDKTQSDVEITYATSDKTAYKDVVDGGWTTKVKIYNNSSDGHSNLKNYKFVNANGESVTELSATLTINKATANIVNSKTTKTYYKNNGGRATITCTGLLDDFTKLEVYDTSSQQWKEVTYSTTVSDSLYERKTDSNGNTIIELRQAYLQSKDGSKANFEVGKKYKFKLTYSDNYDTTELVTELSIENYTAPSNNSSSSSSTTTTAKKVVNTAAQ